jgi:hypothetical protein
VVHRHFERAGVDVMLLRRALALAFLAAMAAPAIAHAGCQDEISRLMSRDTEKMLSRYYGITKRIAREGASPGLRAEECRIARLLEPQLAGEVEALKQSRCRRDPNASNMIADIVRGREDDLAVLRKAAGQPECR